MSPRTPWWWLGPDEQDSLGIGRGAHRTELGFVFGDATSARRLEIVPREQDAPVRMGPIALRVWGDAIGGRDLLRAAVAVLGPRLADDFDPDAHEDASGGASTLDRDGEAVETLVDVPSVCDRACAFCEVSLRPISERRARGSEVGVERALAAAGRNVLFTGDDALSHPSIVNWVVRASSAGRRVSIIGPPRAGATAALAPALARAGLSTWITAILGGDGPTHDRLAGRAGAFAALAEVVPAMRAAGVRVELITPLVRPLLGALGPIRRAALALTGGAPALLAYAPDPETGRALDPVVPTYDELRAALAGLEAESSVDGVPLCVLPLALARSASDRVRRRVGFQVVYPTEPCGGCALRSRCPGAPATVVDAVGIAGLGLDQVRRPSA